MPPANKVSLTYILQAGAAFLMIAGLANGATSLAFDRPVSAILNFAMALFDGWLFLFQQELRDRYRKMRPSGARAPSPSGDLGRER